MIDELKSIKTHLALGAYGRALMLLSKYDHPVARQLLRKTDQNSTIPKETVMSLEITETEFNQLHSFVRNHRTSNWLISVFLLSLGLFNFIILIYGLDQLINREVNTFNIIALSCAASPFGLVSLGLGISGIWSDSYTYGLF